MQRVGIIGAGRFGSVLAQSLAERGVEVLLLDRSAEAVKRMTNAVSRPVQGDATNANALTEAGFADCDSVVVAIGGNMEASILATIVLKEMKVKHVVARAESDIHGKVLERVGADRVIYINRDMARRLAMHLWAPTVLDYFEIADGVSIVEMKAPRKFWGKTIAGLNIRPEYGVTIMTIRRKNAEGKVENLVTPTGEDAIEEEDILVVFGADANVKKLEQLN